MPKLPVYNMQAEQVGEVELNEKLFAAPVRTDLMHEVVLMYLAGQRRGTHKVKGRSEVSGGGRKPWRQKGTGRARQGSIRAPQWKGGGVVFGPTPRSYKYKLTKKVRRAALYSALTSKIDEGKVIVLDQLNLSDIKTKHMVALLKRFELNKALLVDAEKIENVWLSARNIPGIKYVPANGVNVYDLLRHEHLVLTKDAVAKVEEVFA
ncbi:50S ribosomal protein L4 [Alicyclobacillus tolerans]|uniref:Large ribosomal subunit protein uL4 n=2 Tax=Alicyclobacillus tolerans TaxID=90970 RepID=A0ABT9LW89_9BACL|nr:MULTISPECIES: 50S ribosomal protein L4 [Alicyclobacillus]MDP9728503.1 large subunit ribosomal protein L4 [Alicyclobacillus tengchongensis]SHK81513.1 LSU ribosomal protein L4P [Alicyclobacillus montanus]